MDEIIFHTASKGNSKNISLQDIPMAKATGFNAAADDYMELGIDLNEQLIRNKPATYFFRMNSDAMTGAGIKNGDVLIVDRSLTFVSGKIIVAVFDSELLVRRLQKTISNTVLIAENSNYSQIVVTQSSSYSVWGVVTYVIHTVS
jgi:DNA polymerase V